MRTCPQCGVDIPGRALVCPDCGAHSSGAAITDEQGPLPATQREAADLLARMASVSSAGARPRGEEPPGLCPACQGRLAPNAAFCPHCGEPLGNDRQRCPPHGPVPPRSRLLKTLLGTGCGCLCLLLFFAALAIFSFLGGTKKEVPDPAGPEHAGQEVGGQFTVTGHAYACVALDDYRALARVDQNGDPEKLREDMHMQLAMGKCRVLPLGALVYVREASPADKALRVHLAQDPALWWTGVKMLTP